MADSPEHVFDKHFRRYGGRVPDIASTEDVPQDAPEDVRLGIPTLNMAVSSFRKWMEWFAEPANKLCQNRIHGDLLRSSSFNAYAATRPKSSLDLIGVTLPVLFSLRALTAFAAQYFFRGRPPALLAERLRATRWADLRSVKELLKTGPGWDHSDDQRLMHNKLYEACLSCLIMHEVGHLGYGHVDFMEAELGATEMAEVDAESRLPVDLKHIMELEADRSIALHIATRGKDELDIALASCLLLFDTFAQCSASVNSRANESHPHPIVRFTSIIADFGAMTGQSKTAYTAVDRLNSRQGRWIRGGLCEGVTRGFVMKWTDATAEGDRLWDEFDRTYRERLERFRRKV